jgi:acetyl esterase/lipase
LRFLFTAIACLYIAGAAFAEEPHPPYCEPTQDPGIAENNVSAIPEGHVNNTLQDPPGLPMPTEELTPENTVDPSGAYKSYKWSEARWQEPSLQCMWVGHEFVFVPAVDYRSKPAHPTIVYFHPNTLKHTFEKNSPISNNVAKVAVAAGFNFISVEYRHPVTDQYLAYYNNNKIHHQDVGLFMQFLRGNAAKMRISKNNIFSFGYSRGSLALWQALQPDMGGGNTGKPSSLVSAFVGYQAQSTYQCKEYGIRFLDPLHQGTEPSIQMCEETNWWHPQFGSALFDLNPLSAIPVRLQYQSERGLNYKNPSPNGL